MATWFCFPWGTANQTFQTRLGGQREPPFPQLLFPSLSAGGRALKRAAQPGGVGGGKTRGSQTPHIVSRTMERKRMLWPGGPWQGPSTFLWREAVLDHSNAFTFLTTGLWGDRRTDKEIYPRLRDMGKGLAPGWQLLLGATTTPRLEPLEHPMDPIPLLIDWQGLDRPTLGPKGVCVMGKGMGSEPGTLWATSQQERCLQLSHEEDLRARLFPSGEAAGESHGQRNFKYCLNRDK